MAPAPPWMIIRGLVGVGFDEGEDMMYVIGLGGGCSGGLKLWIWFLDRDDLLGTCSYVPMLTWVSEVDVRQKRKVGG